MKFRKMLAVPLFVVALATALFADHVAVDYDHAANFSKVKTYSWSKVHTANSIWNDRVKDAVDKELAAKGWTQVPSGGDVGLVAVEKTSIHQQYDTFYDGFGGWRWAGMGESTTTVDNYKVGTLIVSMFEGNSKQLIWRGTSTSDLSGNPKRTPRSSTRMSRKCLRTFRQKGESRECCSASGPADSSDLSGRPLIRHGG
jgi:hypothetical protein